MIIGAIKEYNKTETRTPLTPLVVKELTNQGHTVLLQKGIGKNAYFYDKDYTDNKAKLLSDIKEIYKNSDIILQINPPKTENIDILTKNQLLISDFTNYDFQAHTTIPQIIQLEKVPRTSVAQIVDILSSQHTIRGYMAAIFALSISPRYSQQLITAATAIKASNALVIGASITGLQAASVFKKQGCKTTILDIKEENKELVQSVGANFIKANTQQELSELLKNQDIIIATATNSKNTPQIIKRELLKIVKNGTIVIDTTLQNIDIKENNLKTNNYIFHRNLYFEKLCPITASELWANNMLNLLNLIITKNNDLNLSTDYISQMLYKG